MDPTPIAEMSNNNLTCAEYGDKKWKNNFSNVKINKEPKTIPYEIRMKR